MYYYESKVIKRETEPNSTFYARCERNLNQLGKVRLIQGDFAHLLTVTNFA